jgi:ribose-phosphate pyrophosphokinase
VIPYYGYSTMERAVLEGEVVGAKTRAQLLSSIPRAHAGNSAVLLDLHADGIAYYFGDAITARHITAKPVLIPKMQELGQDLVIAATDAGRAKWVERLANELGAPPAFCYKRRLSGSRTIVTGINADVAGKTVALYDDMVRTGGSLLQAARAYRDAGAARVVAFTTHFLPTPEAVAKLRAAGAIDRIVCTDSHPRAQGQPADFVEVVSVAKILGEAARKQGS